MRLAIIFVMALMALSPSLTIAQQAGENINVLPVVFPQDDADWFIKGDGYLQRQVEPSIAASTRNPDHLIAFFNDYRAVDVGDDIGLGETETMVALVNTARTIMMAASWLPLPELHLQPAAAAEAWVGMSRSYDGGLTWSGGFLPGAPFDTGSQATLDAPVFGLEAATDPVVAPGPCGKFYVVFMAFTRGDESKLVVARYQDLNNLEGGDSIVYQGMTVVESGNNATNGYFLDKPDIEVDVFRDSNPDICADRVYVSYSTFNGLDNDGKFQSKVSFARSFDGGLTFDTQKLNPPYKQNQGSALAVNPSNGDIHMIWRHFFNPDLILMTTSTNYGRKWSKPSVVTGNLPMAPFDQPTISTTMAPPSTGPNSDFPEVAFRSNGFPTAAVTVDGTLFVAWQERVDLAEGVNRGRPLDGGSPRIVVVRTTDGGRNWTDVDGNADERRAVDMGDRDVPGDPNLPAPGFGALPQYRPSGPQVMPKLSFSGGRLLLAYYESRGRIAGYGTGSETIVPDPNVSADTGFISGYDRLIDLRAAVLDPLTGAKISTSQVSRYPIRAGASLDQFDPYSEGLSDVASVNSPCSPDSGAGYPICIRQVNRVNAPQSAAGTSPFIGDYIDLAPSVQFVFDGGSWRWATGANDVPYRGGHAIFTDNRHLIPPTEVPFGEDPNQDEWDLYRYYSPPGRNILCINGGSRNTDVLTAKVEAELVVSAPTTFKQLDNRRGFPLSVSNRTAKPRSRSYRVEIIEGGDFASFGLYDPFVDAGDVEVFANSSTSLMVYVDALASGRVRVAVTENDCSIDCATGTATFILDPNNPSLPALDGPDTQYPEVTNPFVINPFVINDGAENPFVINPFVINPFVINPFVINPFVINPFVINPFVINPFVINQPIEDVIDTTWTVTAGGSNTASSYLPLINIDNAQAFIDAGYAFQLIAYKGSLYGGLSDCDPVNVAQPQILSNVSQDPNDEVHNPFVINPFVINPFVINPFVINPFVINPFVINQPPENSGIENPFVINPFVINDGVQNPFVINSTFTIAPSDDVIEDGTTKAPPASNDVKVTLRAFKIGTGMKNGGLIYDPLEDPPSLVIVPLPCDPLDPVNCNVFSLAPDLAPVDVDTTPVIADSGGILTGFPDGGWSLLNQGYGDATAENGILRHGFYICDIDFVDSFDTDPRTAPLDINDPLCVFADFLPSASNTLAPQSSEGFVAENLSIPDMTEGDYYLVLYVDDTVEVSELNEVNNWVKIPITIEEPNEPPVATDLTFATDEDTILIESLYVTDPDNDPLTFEPAAGPISGTVEIGDNTFTYTPDENFNGTDSFGFAVFDGEFTVSATVIITVNPINDPPVVTVGPVVVDEDGTAQGVVTATDVDGDPLTYEVTTPPGKGEVVWSPTEAGVFTYEPFDDLNGTDSFTVTVGDTVVVVSVTVNVSITALADPPVALDAADTTAEDTPLTGVVTATDVDGDTLSYFLVGDASNGSAVVNAGGNFTYTPNANFNGVDTFTFKANDGDPTYLDSNTATITITVEGRNDPPTAADAAYEAHENTPLNGTLIGSDIDGDNVTFSIATDPTGGVVTVIPSTGAFTYTPAGSFLGTDFFTFVVSDPSDASATGTVTVNVIDPVPNWDFVGFSTPWRPNYKVNAGSAIPLKWYYADPDNGAMVPSFTDGLEITATGYATCDATGDPTVVLDLPEDAGSSDLRYNDGDWQLNWDTSGLGKGCYFLAIYHPVTNQIDTENHNGDLLKIQLK